ncbi:hypothetical protein NM688_g1370 [Phlebia brevispora]|uniref:Uncharacterized protein n=1 Tax=Phlebia brevispora TaxID=194682 RepID=A0ACC1TBP5_9APHY|nr:hypothetical protein NM688_g1370 [Phlebia brevispora]
MSLRRLVSIAASTPWSRRREDRQDADLSPIRGSSEDSAGAQPLLGGARTSAQMGSYQYGSVNDAGPSSEVSHSRRSSPEYRRHESTLNRVPEEQGADGDEEEDAEQSEEVEWDLEERGLYPGSYRRVLVLYSFVPITAILVVLLLAFAPELFWPITSPRPSPYPQLYPFPLPEVLLSSAMWSMAYLFRLPLYSGVSSILGAVDPFFTTFLFNVVHTIVFNFLRITSLPILGIRQKMQYSRPTWRDPVFRSVWWLSLGWAIIDVIVGIAQSYAQLALYRNVMVPEDRIAEILASSSAEESRTNLLSSSDEVLPLTLSPRHDAPPNGACPGENGKRVRLVPGNTRSLDEAIRLAVDKDLEQLVNLKEREDLEEIYGFPVIRIPVFVSCLQRLDSILLSTGNTLVLSAAFLSSSLSLSVNATVEMPSTNRPFFIAFPIVMLMNLTMSLLHTPLILPRIGVHTTAYIGFLLGLGSFFAGLGLWGALA